MPESKIGKLFLLEYTDKRYIEIHSGNKVGIVLRKHKVKYNFAEESYHVLLEDKFRVIHLPLQEEICYKIKFI